MSWHTKEDVLDDLAEVMGNGVNDFDEQYILRGEQAPPPACTSNEVDNELYLGIHCEHEDGGVSEDVRGPDLLGITEMLRMVDKYHTSSDTENDELSTQNNSTAGITITKVNENVAGFLPMNNENGKIDRVCSQQTIDQANIKELSDKLKFKIGSSSKTNNLKIKQQRNIAISSLLKLHSKENSIAGEITPKLITPEHFQKNSSARLSDKSSQSSSRKLTSARPLLQVENVKSAVETTVENNNMNDELGESVAKVNSWLNKGSDKQQLETRGPALYLGPVTFKKKEITKPKTQNNDVSDKSIKRTMDTNSFIPTEYADKLTQSYMERVKAKEDKSLDIWSKLERDLKVKDEEILSKCHLSPEQSSKEESNGSQS